LSGEMNLGYTIRDGGNWYAYANNDPVNYIDLWGLERGLI